VVSDALLALNFDVLVEVREVSGNVDILRVGNAALRALVVSYQVLSSTLKAHNALTAVFAHLWHCW
jgi:hypothetical protein